MIFDSIYGEIKLPKIIKELLTCPGILRLREIRLGNIHFSSFPAFSNCSRYEHAIGVAHLAEIASESLSLDTKEKIELMIAGLYHDVATPPFAHATEATLNEYYEFNHEDYLYSLIIGATNDPLRHQTQIFQGRGLKLHKILQTKYSRKMGIDIIKIADNAIGKGLLGPMICGTIDLDNIDNITRASNYTGNYDLNKRVVESMATSYIIHNNEIAFSENARSYLEKWNNARSDFYTKLYYSVNDLSIESMIRECIRFCIRTDDLNSKITIHDWKLTERQMVHKFNLNKSASRIYRRIVFGDSYPCLLMFTCNIGENNDPKLICEKIIEFFKNDLEINLINLFFKDGRKRKARLIEVHRPLSKLSEFLSPDLSLDENKYFFCFFSPVSDKKLKILDEKLKFSDLITYLEPILKNCSNISFIKYLNRDINNKSLDAFR